MGRLTCQLTACLMPAVVLLCSVYCACGGQLSLPGRHAAAAQQTPAAHPHCSKHQGAKGHHVPRPAEHDGSEHPGCGHCGSTVAVAPTKVGGGDPPAAVPFDIAALALAPFRDSTSWIVPRPPGDLPPRVCDASLLGLHCALTL